MHGDIKMDANISIINAAVLYNAMRIVLPRINPYHVNKNIQIWLLVGRQLVVMKIM